MGQSLAKNLIHLIFSTKERYPFLDDAVREPLHAYIAGVLKEQDSPCLAINSVADHVHVLFCLNKNADFGWQNGYGAFSVSQSSVADVRQYIANQTEHHRKVTFQEELRAFFKRHEIAYDERYVWE